MIKGLPSVDFKPHDDLMLDLLDDPGNPKNTILNPGEHRIDHILTGFPQYKQKGRWHIMLDNGLNRLAEIYFSHQ
jgi:hypothetical protein